MPTDTATLYFKEGSSDKVYTATIEEAPTGCLVTFAYGRRGSTMTTGTKTAAPVPYEQAKQIFDKLIREKTAKGYKPGEAGAVYHDAAREQRDTSLRPQLLNPIEESEVSALLSDPDYWLQEKFDGRRTLIKKHGADVVATNRLGLSIGLIDTVHRAAASLPHDFTLDGELISDTLFAFDLLAFDGQSLTGLHYAVRLEQLRRLCASLSTGILVVPTATHADDKTALYAQLQRNHKEGVVFKRHNAPYTPGRPNSGGDQVKFKFTATCSALVAPSRNGKRSIGLELLNGDRTISVGNVTVPANQDVPQPGQIVEVRYLYAYPGGSLFQPVLLGVRDDIRREACQVSQLKCKTSAENDEEA